ncbi:MAG: T9SS type A sorting domain-containing protein, partial [Bacteroidia bacterium]
IETSIIDTSCGTARLNISVKDSIPHARIYWYVNDTLIANTDTTLHSFSSLDSQLVRVDISRGNCIYSFYDTIVPSSASPIKIGQIKDVDLCENEFYSKFIDVESKNGIDNFTWSYFSNGQLAFKDSSRKVSFKPTSSGIGSIILSAIDSGGCTLAKNVNVNVRSNHFIALHKDTSLCTSTDFVVKLDTISTFNKGWYVDSNFIGNSFSSKDYKPGKYEVWTSSKVKNYCWYSSFNLAFTPQPNLVVPPSIQTCLKHVPIELQSNYKNTMWVGDQIINDSFFLDNSGVKYIDTVKAKYESVAGCKDSALMTIYNGYDTSSIKMPSLIDVCYSTDTFLNIGNVDSGYWSTGKYFFSRITDSTYKVLTKVLQVGNQKAVFEGVTKKGCIDTRSVILSRKNKIDFSVRAANNVVCMDTTSLFSKPSTKRWSGYGVLDSASKYYFKPNGKSGLFTLKAVYWEKGCSASDSLQIKVKEDIRLKKTDFQPKVCLGDTVFFEYPIGNDGYWYDMNKYSSVNSAVGYVVPKKRDTILQRFRYHLPTTKLREKYCNNLDTIRFTPMPYPKVYMDDTLAFCDIDSLVKLKGNPAQVSWFGSIVYPKDDEYLVNPRFIINGVSYANLNKTNANGCTTKKRVFLAKRPTPVVVADSDTSICVDESGYIYNFKNTNGKWSGKYLNGLTSIKLDYNYPLGSYKYVLQKSNKFNCVARDEFILEMGRSYDTNISADTTWGEAPLEVEFTSDLNYAKNLIWYFGNGDSALNTLNTNYTYNQVGKFSVSLIVSDSLNICKTRTVKSNMITVVKSNSILDNGDISVELYPNPSKGSFLLINQTSKVIDAKVYNTDGQLIETMGEIKDEILFGEEYQTGTYILKILDGDGSERVFSLIKL